MGSSPVDNTYYLNITIGEWSATSEHHIPFDSREDAIEQLRLLEPKMGHGKFRNDPEQNRHRVVSPDGETIVVMEHVIAARVVDQRVFDERSAYKRTQNEASDDRVIQKIATALVIANKMLDRAE